MMVASKKTPTIDIFPLADHTDMDFFPEYRADVGEPHHRTIMQSLKDGTYTPYLQHEPYDWEIKKSQFTASLSNQDVISHPNAKLFTASVPDADRVKQLEDMYRDRIPIRRKYYANPRQYYDHILLADAYTNSFAGTVIDTWTDFNIPREIKPVLKLRKPSGDKEKDAKEIDSNKEILERLMGIDNWYSDNGPKSTDGYFDVPFQQKIKSAFRLREVFGRDAIVKEKWDAVDPVTLDNEELTDIPNVLKVMHPIEMQLTEIDIWTGKVAGIWLSNDQPYIAAQDMIYLVNEYNPPMIGAQSYGFSRLQRSIDQVRLYRRLLAKNLPQYMRSSASGMGAFLVNTTGYDEETRGRIRTQLKNAYRIAELAVIDYANIKDFEYKEFKINTDVDALVKLEEAMLKTIANVIGVPQSIILDAGSPARATLVGRLLTFMNNNVTQSRTTFGQQLANQWYMPNFRILYKDQQDILEKFYISVRFEEVSLETKEERINRLLLETQLNPYTDEYLGEELEDPDYATHVDEEKRKEQEKMEKMQMQFSMSKKPGTKGPADPDDSAGGTFSARPNSVGNRGTTKAQ